MRRKAMRVCIVGSGGREHALALSLAKTAEVVVTPGNPGIARSGLDGLAISCTDSPAEQVNCDLYVIGPEAPLVAGLADRLRSRGGLVFGPGADGARLEGSKAWMKRLASQARVPTARYATFDSLVPAVEYLRSLPGPYVVKTDGLAAGKGVLVTDSLEEAERDVAAKLSGESFGDAGRRVVIEEGLFGPELSVLAICDGRRAFPLAPAQDFKRLGDGDTGPNTGGMGAYSPVSHVGPEIVEEVMERAIEPLIFELRRSSIDYRGVIYAGLMLTDEGPKVIEYNVRFGDPEAQVILPRAQGDLAAVLARAAAGRLCLEEPDLTSDGPPQVCVVLSARGYPAHPRTGDPIYGIDEARSVPEVTVVHAATALDSSGRLVTSGGRVLGIVGQGPTLKEARERAYRAAGCISFDGLHYRSDIAVAAIAELGGAGGASGG